MPKPHKRSSESKSSKRRDRSPSPELSKHRKHREVRKEHSSSPKITKKSKSSRDGKERSRSKDNKKSVSRANRERVDSIERKQRSESRSASPTWDKKRKRSESIEERVNSKRREPTEDRVERRKERGGRKRDSPVSPADDRFGRYGSNDEKPSRYWGTKDKAETRGSRHTDDIDHVVGSRYYGSTEEKKRRPQSDLRPQLEKTSEKPPKPRPESAAPKKSADPISSKTGGAYIPPAMLKLMQASVTDKSSAEYQRISWEALKKSIHGLINKVNRTNIDKIIRHLLKENIVRGRGLLCRSIIQAQAMSPTFSHVYAALAALINSRFPNIGELLLKRLVLQFRRGFKRNDKPTCISAAAFLGHLVNQRVAHEIIALEVLSLLVETPTDDSIEVAIAFMKECGLKLTEVSKKGVDAIFEMLRNVLNERKVDLRVQNMIEVMLQIRKDKFKDHEVIPDGLDLVEEDDQFTHLITLDDATDGEDILNVFKVDPEYLVHEEKYKELSKEMVGDSGDSESGEDDDEDDEEGEDEDDDGQEDGESKQVIVDNTETNLVTLRRTIYLAIYSSLDFEECVHKLMRMQLKPGQEPEVCAMILDCCCEMRTYERFYGLLAQRFCQVNRTFIPPFEQLFKDTYQTVHRLKTNQSRNVAKLFAHLLFTDAISWDVLSSIRLTEEDTTSSSRVFIKMLFHELSEYMGLVKLNLRVKDPTLQEAFAGLFPRDNPRSTRFSINFFTSIGLGGLTDDLREHLKTAVLQEPALLPGIAVQNSSGASSDDSTTDSSESSENDSSDPDSSGDSSEDEKNRRRHSKKKRAVSKSKKSKSLKKRKKSKKSK